MTGNYLLFRLGERLFGLPMEGALEIVPWRRSRPVPLAYSYVEGLISYRGEVYGVYQLSQLLGLPKPGPIGFAAAEAPAPGKDRSIILFREGERRFGIAVDSVVKMTKLEPSDEQAADIAGVQSHLIKGRSFEDDQEIILLSFERFIHAG